MQPNNPSDNSGWTYRQEGVESSTDDYTQPQANQATIEPVTWTASEFIAHHKSFGWYFALVLGYILLAIPIYYFTKDVISVISISIVFILFLIVSGSKPRQRGYTVGDHGIAIDAKYYPYTMFKSFAISREGAIGCINLAPLKRFMPEMAIYYAPDDEARIVDVLARSLPNEVLNEKMTDKLVKRIRF